MYYVYLNGEQTGPYSKEQIIDMIKNGSLNEAYVYGENYADWTQPSVCPEFSAFFQDAASPAPQTAAAYPVYFYYNEQQYELNSDAELTNFLSQVQDQENLYIYSNEKGDWTLYQTAPLSVSATKKTSDSTPVKEEPAQPKRSPAETPSETQTAEKQLQGKEKAVKPSLTLSDSLIAKKDAAAAVCKFHPSSKAELLCAACKADICDECRNLFNGKVLCPECLKIRQAKHKKKTIIEIIVAVVLFIILGIVFYTVILK